jgi:hypothetical protein
MTAQAEPSTRHSSGTNGVAHTTMPPMITNETETENQNLVNGGDMYVRTHGAKGHKVAAPFHNFGDFLKEIGAFDFFLCRTPCHIVREQVCENSLAQGNAEPSKKEKADC